MGVVQRIYCGKCCGEEPGLKREPACKVSEARTRL